MFIYTANRFVVNAWKLPILAMKICNLRNNRRMLEKRCELVNGLKWIIKQLPAVSLQSDKIIHDKLRSQANNIQPHSGKVAKKREMTRRYVSTNHMRTIIIIILNEISIIQWTKLKFNLASCLFAWFVVYQTKFFFRLFLLSAHMCHCFLPSI